MKKCRPKTVSKFEALLVPRQGRVDLHYMGPESAKSYFRCSNFARMVFVNCIAMANVCHNVRMTILKTMMMMVMMIVVMMMVVMKTIQTSSDYGP